MPSTCPTPSPPGPRRIPPSCRRSSASTWHGRQIGRNVSNELPVAQAMRFFGGALKLGAARRHDGQDRAPGRVGARQARPLGAPPDDPVGAVVRPVPPPARRHALRRRFLFHQPCRLVAPPLLGGDVPRRLQPHRMEGRLGRALRRRDRLCDGRGRCDALRPDRLRRARSRLCAAGVRQHGAGRGRPRRLAPAHPGAAARREPVRRRARHRRRLAPAADDGAGSTPSSSTPRPMPTPSSRRSGG